MKRLRRRPVARTFTVAWILLSVLALFLITDASAVEIPLEKRGGVYTLPVRINGAITLPFVLDSGASEVVIPVDVVLTLVRTGTIRNSDFLPGKTYTMADGTQLKSPRFIIRELELGGIKIFNVPASVAPPAGDLLLGQSLLERLGLWSLDYNRHVLIIGVSNKGKCNSTTSRLKTWERQVAAPLRPIIGKLQQCSIPVYLPSSLKITDMYGKACKIYVLDNKYEHSCFYANWYMITFGDSPNCNNRFCEAGFITANKGFDIGSSCGSTPEHIMLSKVTNAVYLNNSRAGYQDEIQFFLDGVTYDFSFGVVGKGKETIIRIVKSALKIGPLPK